MSDIVVRKQNEVYDEIVTDRGILRELSDFFTFEVPGAKYMPSYKNRMWDGKIRLLNLNTAQLYCGLSHYLKKFCDERNYTLSFEYNNASESISLHEAKEYLSKQDLTLEPRDYQFKAFVDAIRGSRGLFVSPTASGKSFIMYMIMRWYLKRTLIIVPTTTLVHQLFSDFESYGFNSEKFVHKIFAGQSKNTKKPVVITTWQSIYKQPKEWFDQFDVVFGDEAHLFKAKSLTTIMTNLENCKYRFGFTGTLDDSLTHQWVLEGLFGPVRRVITTKELMDTKHVADLKIKIITLRHNDNDKAEYRDLIKQYKNDKKKAYQYELKYLIQHEKRNEFIRNLTLSLNGNTLLLFQMVETHGKVLYNLILDSVPPDRKVFFIHGGVKGSDRDAIRAIVEKETNAIIIASYGVFSTGVNIKNLDSLIAASPSKSKIRVLQSIGRVLRISDTKDSVVLYDIADELVNKSSKMNYTLDHLIQRIDIYDREQFNYKLYQVNL